jgi:hypothetical protein
LVESAKASKDVSTTIRAHLGIAIYKSLEGFHQRALTDLENLYPLAHYSQPVVFFDYLNSLAVELGEVGRKDEARNVSRIVLASPFAPAYPEWRQTAEDLRPARRSFVAFSSHPSNVLTLPGREPSQLSSPQPEPAQVLDFAKLRKRIAKKRKKQDEEKSVYQMSLKDMGYRLLELVTDNRASEAQMRTLLLFALKLFYGCDEPPDKPSA